MSSPETFIAFAAIMFVIALIGAAIDWFGTPLRHRKFVPKAFRFPDEKLFRNESLHNPYVAPAQSSPAGPYLYEEVVIAGTELGLQDRHGGIPSTPVGPLEHDGSENDTPVGVEESFPIVEGEDDLEIEQGGIKEAERGEVEPTISGKIETPPKKSGTLRLRGWTPGGYVFNLTQDGREPSPATVRTRYWKNVSAAAGSAIFGANNIERMQEGKPPQRRNYRSGKTETMRISPKSFEESGGEIPIPYWPSTAVDPFRSIK